MRKVLGGLLTVAGSLGLIGAVVTAWGQSLPVPSSIFVKGDIAAATDGNNLDGIAAVAAGQILASQGASTLPAWSTDLTIGNGTPTVTQDGEDGYIEGTFEVDGAVRLDGALSLGANVVSATGVELDEYAITVEIEDVCAASSAWVVAPHAGDVTAIYTVIDAALGTGDAVLDPQIATVSITAGGITITASGSAAGDVDSATPSAANTLTAGQAVEIATDGGCDAAAGVVKTEVSLLIAR